LSWRRGAPRRRRTIILVPAAEAARTDRSAISATPAVGPVKAIPAPTLARQVALSVTSRARSTDDANGPNAHYALVGPLIVQAAVWWILPVERIGGAGADGHEQLRSSDGCNGSSDQWCSAAASADAAH
jgi:hypothetical protein